MVSSWLITQNMNFLKKIKKWFIGGAIPLAFIAGTAMPESFDCKGQECQVQVIVSESTFKDAIYYKPDVWDEKTPEEIEAEATQRFENWLRLVEESSNSSSTDETP